MIYRPTVESRQRSGALKFPSGVILLLIGPIFRWESAAIARRERNYVIRWIYGLVILTCFCFPVLVKTGLSSAQELDHRELAAASMASFAAMLWGQAVALFLATPAFFAGAIAQEVERGNLILLLASPLKSVEIILGKLGPRMAQVVSIVSVAVPVLGLLSLNGGVDDRFVILSNAVLLTSALLIASIALLISIVSADVRQAVMWTYVAEILWLFAPAIAEMVAAITPAPFREWPSSIGDFCAIMTPVRVLWELTTLPASLVGDFFTTMAVQLGTAIVLIAMAAALLRPVSKGSGPFGWRLAPVSFLLSRRRLLPRSACGARPVLWKEMHVARTQVLTRLLIALAFVALLYPLVLSTWETAEPAFRELKTAGYGLGVPMALRVEFNVFLRFMLVFIYLVSGIGLAVFCSTSMTHEKERDTWTSLIGTPLEASEIVGQKIMGALWRLRWPGLLYILLLALGFAAGSIHPLGAILNLVQLIVFLGFVAVLGTYLSLRCKSSVRALGWTLFWLFWLNGGYLLGCILVHDLHPAVAFLVSPALLTFSLATYSELDWFFKNWMNPGFGFDMMCLIVLNFLFYAVSAKFLWSTCARQFDKAAGRPRRDGQPSARVRAKAPAIGLKSEAP